MLSLVEEGFWSGVPLPLSRGLRGPLLSSSFSNLSSGDMLTKVP